LIFFIPNITYFEEKNIHLSEGPFFKFFHKRTKKKIETPQNKENAFTKTILYIYFANPKLHEP
jgi:hypothetical protein